MKSIRSVPTYIRTYTLIKVTCIIFAIIFIFGVIIHIAEPYTFPTIGDGLWWAMVTTFTVGYGDLVPISPAGRFFAVILILLGTGFGSYYMVSFSTQAFKNQIARSKGQVKFKEMNHIVIVGWNERVRNVILQLEKLSPYQWIVLIDESLNEIPFQYKNIFFIKGNPTNDEILLKANLSKANTILITADQNKNEYDADMQTILTILAAKGVCKEITCLAEILTSQQVSNAIRAGATEIIRAHLLTSYVMSSSILYRGVANVFLALANQENHSLRLEKVSEHLYEKSFEEVLQDGLQKQLLIIGIIRGYETFFYPKDPFLIQRDDLLITIVQQVGT